MISFSRRRDEAALAVGLANTWDVLEPNPEFLTGVPKLQRLLRFYGQGALAKRVADADVARVVKLRNRLRHTFEAGSQKAAAEILNSILRENASPPQLVRGPGRGGWVYRHHDEDAPVARVLAVSSALALAEVIRAGDWSRFGRCAAAPCCCVFIDISRNRSRCYCSRLCADRMSQAAYRRRRREQAASRSTRKAAR